MELTRDFKEFIELLNAHEVKYLIVGEYAVNYHGYIRFTGDLDFWIWIEKENIKKLLSAINEFGFGSLKLNSTDFVNPENIIQFGVEPNRIDLLVDVDTLNFEQCYTRRVIQKKEGVEMNIISIDDLIIAKEAAGRPQDLADVYHIKKVKEIISKNKK